MKFSISAERFFYAVSKLNYVVPASSHTTLPILSNIYFNLTGKNLNLVSTDLESFIVTSLQVDGTEDGGVAIPARKLLELLKAMIIKIEAINGIVPLSADNYGILVSEKILPELNTYGIKFDTKSESLVYKGSFPEESFNLLNEELKTFKEHYGAFKDDDLKKSFEKFEKAVTSLEKQVIDLFKKETEKLKIKVESNDKFKVSIISSKGKYQFFGEPIEDYPLPEERKGLSKVEVNGLIIKKYIQKVKHSIKNDEIRRNMAGIFFDFDVPKSELKFVATDGYRLSKVITNQFKPFIEKNENFILPLKTVDLLPKILSDDNIVLEFDNSVIRFKVDNLFIYSKLIDDTFPNYENVIPKDNDKKLIINRYELLAALRRASIFTDKVTKKVKFEINGDELKLYADNPEIGSEGEETIGCKFMTIQGDIISESYSIAFNIEYLLQCLTQIESDEVVIDLSTPSKATIVKSHASLTDEDYTELIMPIRVG